MHATDATATIAILGLDGSSKTLLCRALTNKTKTTGTGNKNTASSCFHATAPSLLAPTSTRPFREYIVSREDLLSQSRRQQQQQNQKQQEKSRNDDDVLVVSAFTPSSSRSSPSTVGPPPATATASATPAAALRGTPQKESGESLVFHPNAIATTTPTTTQHPQRGGTIIVACSSTKNQYDDAGDDHHVASRATYKNDSSPPQRKARSEFSSFALLDTSGSALLRGAWLPVLLGDAVDNNNINSSSHEHQINRVERKCCDGLIFCIDGADVLRVSFAWTELVQLIDRFVREQDDENGWKKKNSRLPVLVVFVRKTDSSFSSRSSSRCFVDVAKFQSHILPSLRGGDRDGGADVKLSKRVDVSFADVVLSSSAGGGDDVSMLTSWMFEAL